MNALVMHSVELCKVTTLCTTLTLAGMLHNVPIVGLEEAVTKKPVKV